MGAALLLVVIDAQVCHDRPGMVEQDHPAVLLVRLETYAHDGLIGERVVVLFAGVERVLRLPCPLACRRGHDVGP